MQSSPPIDEERNTDNEGFLDHEEQSARQSESQDASGATYPLALPPPIPLYTPFPTLAVSNFLTNDDGASLIEEGGGDELPDEAIAVETLPSAAASSSSTLWLSRTRSRSSITSTSTVTHSTSHLARASRFFSRDSVVEHLTTRAGEKIFPLADFCKLIEEHASLERAKILSVECYKEPIQFGIVHRTLIFHLRRERRTDVWMRVDRRRSRDVPFRVFAMRGGRTEANDVALLAGTKADLLNRRSAVLENQMEFQAPPNLGVFRFCLQVICEELLEYHIWPENCWFMCSLLQGHLFETGHGSFRQGSHIRLNLAPRIRARVRNRVWHVVTPSTLSLAEGPRTGEDASTPLADVAPRWKTLDGGLDTRDFDERALDMYLSDLARTLMQHHQMLLDNPSHDTARVSIIEVASRALRLEFILLQHTSAPNSSRIMDFLSANPTYISSYTDFPPLCRLFLRFRRLSNETAPKTSTPFEYRQLIRASRALSKSHPSLSRDYATEARAIVAPYAEGGRYWTKGQVLGGHNDQVECVAFSPDGKQIASASEHKAIGRWDALTGESISEPMRGYISLQFVRAVAFSPDRTQIVSASFDHTLQRWDASTNKPIGAPMPGHNSDVLSVAYSPDGKLIASSSFDGTIRRWDASTDESIGEPLKGHRDMAQSIAFSPDGKRIVSGSWDKTIRLWDTITGKAVGEPWKGHTGGVSSVAFSPDGGFVVSGSFDQSVRRWDALTGDSIGVPMTGHTKDVNCVAISPDGKQIASASVDCTIRIWDATTGEPIGEPLEGHTSFVQSVAFSPDGRQLVSGSCDWTVRIWDSLEDLDRWAESE